MGPLYCIAKASKVLHFNGFRQNAQHVVAFQLASNTSTSPQQQKETQISSFRSSRCMWAHKQNCVLRTYEHCTVVLTRSHFTLIWYTISVCAISSKTVTHTDTSQVATIWTHFAIFTTFFASLMHIGIFARHTIMRHIRMCAHNHTLIHQIHTHKSISLNFAEIYRFVWGDACETELIVRFHWNRPWHREHCSHQMTWYTIMIIVGGVCTNTCVWHLCVKSWRLKCALVAMDAHSHS